MSLFHPLVICGSARAPSNTQKAVVHFMGECVPFIALSEKKILPYSYTLKNPRDDFWDILQMLLDADPLVFATPVYWHSMSGLLKTFFDRMTDLLDPALSTQRMKLKEKRVVVVADSAKGLPEGFEVPFKGLCTYFSMTYCGCWDWIESQKPIHIDHNQQQLLSFKARWSNLISAENKNDFSAP